MATADEQAGNNQTAHRWRVSHLVVIALVGCTSEDALAPALTGECLASNPHDEDGDGIPDSCDVCPGVPDPKQTDLGEEGTLQFRDGVGDACDPRPTRAGDTLVEFHTFATDESRQWLGDGWHIGADVARAISPARWQHRVAEQGDGLYLQANISIVWLAAAGSFRLVADDVEGVGYSCAVVRDRDGDGDDEFELQNGTATPITKSLGTRVDGPITVTVWRTIDRKRVGEVFCRVQIGRNLHEIALDNLDDFATGGFAFAAEGALADVASLAVYTFPVNPCSSSTGQRACENPEQP